jgi:hypothetical protein
VIDRDNVDEGAEIRLVIIVGTHTWLEAPEGTALPDYQTRRLTCDCDYGSPPAPFCQISLLVIAGTTLSPDSVPA